MIEPKALSGTGQVGSPVQRQPKQGPDALQSLVLIRSCSLVACKLLRSTTQTRSFSDYIYMCIGVSFLIYIETNAELLYCTSLFLLFMDREREGMGASGSRKAAAAASSGPLAPAPEGAGELRHRQQEVRVR
jgi:hypothetical protein